MAPQNSGETLVTHDEQQQNTKKLGPARMASIATFFAAVASAFTANAQDANEVSSNSDQSKMTEVLVTAQKREERLQDVPVPVSVLDTQTLSENDQVLLRDFNGAVPGLTITPSIENEQNVTIRGISSGTLSSKTVAVTIDDVPTNALVVPDFDPGDLARIEVLRGPQGTLYGADSLGGLVNYVTADPSVKAFSGRVQMGGSTVANSSELGYNVRGSANIPLADTFAVRASAFTREDPGYIDNVATGQNGVNEAKVYGGRLATLWSPSDAFSLKLSALYQHLDGAEPLAYVPTPGYPNTAGLGPLQENAYSGAGDFTRAFQIYNAVLKVRLGGVDLVSLTGYNITKADYSFNYTYLFGSAFQHLLNLGYQPGAEVLGTIDSSKFSEEIRASSQIGSHIDWVLGAFYTHEANPADKTVLINAVTPVTGQLLANEYYFFLPASYEETAAFADLTFHFTEQFDVQVGGRESWDKPVTEQSITTAPGATEPTVTPGFSGRVSAATYLFTPRYKISQDLMVYARVASGYQPGGPNSTYGSAPGIPQTYDAATSWTYEGGFKGEVLDNRLSIDTSIYYIDWSNIQLALTTDGLGYSGNGGAAKSEGVEFALESQPLAGLKLSSWVTYDDAVLTNRFPINASLYGAPGERLPNASRFSGNLAFEQELPLGSQLTGFVGGDVSYVGDSFGVFTGGNGVPAPRQTYPGYAKVDLHAGVNYSSWKAILFVTNLANRRAVIDGGIGEYPPFAYQYITPRTIGLNLMKLF